MMEAKMLDSDVSDQTYDVVAVIFLQATFIHGQDGTHLHKKWISYRAPTQRSSVRPNFQTYSAVNLESRIQRSRD